jgi:hypothetical protein
MGTHDTEHEWYRRKLPVAAAGILRPDDDDRVRAHLEGCEECAERWDRFAPSDAEDFHLSSRMIARWSQASTKLVGLERELVTHHLERCEECREDLQMAGFSPALDDSAGSTQHRPRRAAASAHSPRRSWWQGAAVGAAVGLLAAALAWVAWTPTADSPVVGVLPWVVPGQLRGGPVEIPAGSKSVALTVAVPLEFDLQKAAALEVFGPEGEVLLDTDVEATAMAQSTIIVVLRGSRSLGNGFYEVVFRQAGTEERSSFELRTRGPR